MAFTREFSFGLYSAPLFYWLSVLFVSHTVYHISCQKLSNTQIRMAIAIGASFGGIFAGITVHYTNSWRWGLGLHTILTGISFLMVLFFLAETNFDRPPESELGLEAVSVSGHGTAVEVAAPRSALATWAHSLKAWGWYDHKTSLLTHFWWPIKVMYYPAVIWSSLLYGVILGWVVIEQTVDATAFPEIYGFSDLGVGNLNIAVCRRVE